MKNTDETLIMFGMVAKISGILLAASAIILFILQPKSYGYGHLLAGISSTYLILKGNSFIKKGRASNGEPLEAKNLRKKHCLDTYLKLFIKLLCDY